MTQKDILTDSEILSHYIKMGEVISEMFRPHLEVIIHDLRFPEHSIIAIFNNHITGRKVGSGTSDIGYKKIKGKIPEKVINYKNESPDGKPLKSSTLTIRNSDNKIIGSLGLNYDVSVFNQFAEVLSFFTQTDDSTSIKEKEANLKKSFLENAKKSEIHKKIMENFSDAELIDIKIGEQNND